MARKVVIEVEVPEGVDWRLFERVVRDEAERMARLVEAWRRGLVERPFTRGEEVLLREIKRGVAERSG